MEGEKRLGQHERRRATEEEKSSSVPCRQMRKGHDSRKEERRWQHVDGVED